jgi:hypothetical protein
MLVANKLDLAEEQRQVTYQEGLDLAKQLQLAGFVETSAKDGNPTLDDSFFVTCVNAFDSHQPQQPAGFPGGQNIKTFRYSSDRNELFSSDRFDNRNKESSGGLLL